VDKEKGVVAEKESEYYLLKRRKEISDAFVSIKLPIDLATTLNLLIYAGWFAGFLDLDRERCIRLFEAAYEQKAKYLKMRVLHREPKRIDQREDEWVNMKEVMDWIEMGFDGVVFTTCECGDPACPKKGIWFLKCNHKTSEGHIYKVVNELCPDCFTKKQLEQLFPEYIK